MSDDRWEELLRSPLDLDYSEGRERRDRTVLGWLAAAAVAGVVAGVVAAAATAEAESVEAVTTTNAPGPTIIVEAPPTVPAGYADLGSVGVRPELTFTVGDDSYVVVSSAVRSDLDPAEVADFRSGRWLLDDGSDLAATREITDRLAPGVRVVEFEDVDLGGSERPLLVWEGSADVALTSCNGCGSREQRIGTETESLEGVALPYAAPEPFRFEVDRGLTIVVDTFEVAAEWGYVEWHLETVEAEAAATAQVEVVVTFLGTDDPGTDDVDVTLLLPRHRQPAGFAQMYARPFPPFTRSGSEHLGRVGEPLSSVNIQTGLEVEWTVSWRRPVGNPVEVVPSP